MTLLSFMFLIFKTNKTLSCFTRLISLHDFFNSLNGKSACFQNFSHFNFVILNFYSQQSNQNKQKMQDAVLPEVFSSKNLYIMLPKKYPLLMCAVLKEENRCLNFCVVSQSKLLAWRSDVLERSIFQKPAVTFDCPLWTWFLMQNILHTGHITEEL